MGNRDLIEVPGTRQGVLKRLDQAPKEVQEYFRPVGDLIENSAYPWEGSLSYLFAKTERGHLRAIVCGVVKLHNVDVTLARTAVDKFQNTRDEFQQVFVNVFQRKIPLELQKILERPQKVRDHVLHGKSTTGQDYRMSVVALIEYATQFNELCDDMCGYKPFGSLRGFKGTAKPLNRKTSRWVLKGFGLPLS